MNKIDTSKPDQIEMVGYKYKMIAVGYDGIILGTYTDKFGGGKKSCLHTSYGRECSAGYFSPPSPLTMKKQPKLVEVNERPTSGQFVAVWMFDGKPGTAAYRYNIGSLQMYHERLCWIDTEDMALSIDKPSTSPRYFIVSEE